MRRRLVRAEPARLLQQIRAGLRQRRAQLRPALLLRDRLQRHPAGSRYLDSVFPATARSFPEREARLRRDRPEQPGQIEDADQRRVHGFVLLRALDRPSLLRWRVFLVVLQGGLPALHQQAALGIASARIHRRSGQLDPLARVTSSRPGGPARLTWLVRTNDEVAALLAEYADLLAITGGDAFRIRSYEKAARSVGGYPEDLARADPAELDQIPNVGRAIAAKIRDYLGTGHIRQLEAMRARVPDGVRRLTGVAGLGPKRAMVLYTERGIDSIDELEAAIAAGRLEGLPGFGPKSGENLLRGIELIRRSAGRIRIDTAMDLATELIASLSGVPGCPRG